MAVCGRKTRFAGKVHSCQLTAGHEGPHRASYRQHALHFYDEAVTDSDEKLAPSSRRSLAETGKMLSASARQLEAIVEQLVTLKDVYPRRSAASNVKEARGRIMVEAAALRQFLEEDAKR